MNGWKRQMKGQRREKGDRGKMLLTVPDEEIERVRRGEVSQAEMARRYNVSRQAIHDRLNYMRKGLRKRDKDRILRQWLIYFLYLIGFTKKEIAKEIGCQKSLVNQILKRLKK